jgi:hypothetical protein
MGEAAEDAVPLLSVCPIRGVFHKLLG